jgi:hypothetical protein
MADGKQELTQLEKEGFSPESGPEGWVDRNLGNIGTVAGFLDPFTEPAELTAALGKTIAGDVTDSASGATVQLSHPKQDKAEIAKAQAKQQAAAQQKALKQELEEAASSPWTTAANALSQSFQADLQAVQPDISGAAIPAAQTSAASGAAADLGLSSMSPGAQWLAQGASDAQAQTQGVAGAMNAESQAYANAAGPISKAITQWGLDNAIQSMTAGQGAFLNALASHVNSNVSYYGGIAPAQVPEIKEMPAIVQAFQEAGGGTSGSGLTPLTAVKVSPTGQVNVPAAASTLSGAGVISPSLTAPPATNAGAG